MNTQITFDFSHSQPKDSSFYRYTSEEVISEFREHFSFCKTGLAAFFSVVPTKIIATTTPKKDKGWKRIKVIGQDAVSYKGKEYDLAFWFNELWPNTPLTYIYVKAE